MVPDSKKMDMPYVVAATAKWVGDLGYSQHTENQRHELQQVDIRSFVVSDFEHMKTSLCLTDVVVLRHEGDTVNFFGLEITKTSKGFEVKKKYRLRGIPFESLRVGKLEIDSQSWQTFDSDGAGISNSSGWSTKARDQGQKELDTNLIKITLLQKEMNTVTHYSLVHKFIPMPQALKIPDAKAEARKK